MNLARPVALLFGLNFIDAILTLIWVRSGIATESNNLMAALLDLGDAPFLGFKLFIGALAAAVLIYGSNYRVAQYAVNAALVVYVFTLGVHVLTGLVAFELI